MCQSCWHCFSFLGRTLLLVFLIGLGLFDCGLLGMFALLIGKSIYLAGQIPYSVSVVVPDDCGKFALP